MWVQSACVCVCVPVYVCVWDFCGVCVCVCVNACVCGVCVKDNQDFWRILCWQMGKRRCRPPWPRPQRLSVVTTTVLAVFRTVSPPTVPALLAVLALFKLWISRSSDASFFFFSFPFPFFPLFPSLSLAFVMHTRRVWIILHANAVKMSRYDMRIPTTGDASPSSSPSPSLSPSLPFSLSQSFAL